MSPHCWAAIALATAAIASRPSRSLMFGATTNKFASARRTKRASSGNAARSLGFSDRGEIAPGKLADLVFLDDGLNVRAVYKLGRKVF